MRRREIQVFSISFLDLLSGALGAVIILFITVPKARMEQDSKSQPKAMSSFGRSDNKNSDQMKEELEKSMQQVAQLTQEKDELKKMVETLEEQAVRSMASPEKEEVNSDSGKQLDVGFRFKGKKIVFLIDVSGSMFEEDRIGQVKAGLKMLITSMSSDYHIDVIFFPNGEEGDYGYLWGETMPMTVENKSKVYEYLFDLEPFGHTPTRAVLQFALGRYQGATDFVVLSDGAPTSGISAKLDNIGDILRMVQQNAGGRQVNTIGVGSHFLQNKQSPEYMFLESLAKDSSGFFVGF